MIESGNFPRIKQSEKEATLYTHKRTLKDSFIDWNEPLRELYNEIRACDPEDYPAFFFVDGRKVCIRMWRLDKFEDGKDMI
jgi:methionyl-tRNA formyltransferase